jgi:ATP-dependent Clp protease ATP-binding subunit ClpA
MVRAQEAAQRLGVNDIGTEHILLGIVDEEGCIAAKALQSTGVNLANVRERAEAAVNHSGQTVQNEMLFTPPAKRVIELAFAEARALNHYYIGTEHLLLGLVRERDGIAARVLTDLGVRYQDLRSAISSLRPTKPETSTREVPAEMMTQTQGAMWEPFTKDARRTIVLAQKEAARLGNNYMGTEHLLLGIISEGESVAAKVLETGGVDLAKARREVEAIVRAGGQTTRQEKVFTPHALRVIELAFEEARQLDQNYIGAEHLLLGLIREGEGVAARVLAKFADVDRMGTQIRTLLGERNS